MRDIFPILTAVFLCLPIHGATEAAQYSQLWGQAGERWTPRSRLPDFSFAGYRTGEAPLPEPEQGRSVREFGAMGDGTTDDTEAFLKALREAGPGTIEVPPGRYKLTRPLVIDRPGVVLRGAGPQRSVLFFPKPLNQIEPNWGATTSGRRTSNYSWSGGFITLRGSYRSKTLAKVIAEARRGDKVLTVDAPSAMEPGQWVEFYQKDRPDNSLAVHLYSGDAGPVSNLNGRTHTSLACRVTRVEGSRVHLDRPLRCDVRSIWNPVLRRFDPTVVDSGIEGLGFEFPNQPYQGHFTELGYNAIALSGVAHCWVRNVRILNADSGLFVRGHFNTLEGVVLESERRVDSQGCVGHHGISVGGADNLITHFDVRTRYIHDLTVSGFCSGNVFAEGRGLDLSLDHHRYAPHENLFTDLDAGAGLRLWKCGGGAALGKHCGARGTFWNIRSDHPLGYPPTGFGPPSMNLVALETEQPSETSPEGKWFEAIPPEAIVPANLHAAQKARRCDQDPEPTDHSAGD